MNLRRYVRKPIIKLRREKKGKRHYNAFLKGVLTRKRRYNAKLKGRECCNNAF